MNLRGHLENWQVRWAERWGIALGAPPGNPASRATGYVNKLDDNLFEPLSERVKRQLIAGAGGELDAPDGQSGNLFAVCSSSALCMNLFHCWSRLLEQASADSRPSIEPLLTALGLPIGPVRSIDFEVPNTVNPHFKAAPHADVQLSFEGGPWRCAGIEAKFCEPYGDHKLGGLYPVYLSQTALWQGWPNVRALAQELSPSDRMHSYLHAAQLLKHLLGLRKQNGTNFVLVYLWFNVPGSDEAMQHRREIESFSEVLQRDGVAFISKTYQEVFDALRCGEGELESPHVAYLLERYVSGMMIGVYRAQVISTPSRCEKRVWSPSSEVSLLLIICKGRCFMMEATLSSKGQATIPKAVRERLQINAGDRFKFFFHPDGVILLPRIPTKRLKGSLPKLAKPVSVREIDVAIEAGATRRFKGRK